MDGDLKQLEKTLWKIKAVLHDAEEKQIKNILVKRWLNELNHLAYDAEDVLDEFATKALGWKLEAQSQSDANQVWNFNSFLTSLTQTVDQTFDRFKREIGSKIKNITKKLQVIAKERSELGLRDDVGGKSPEIRQRLPSSSLVDESGVFGREEEKEKIIEQVLSDEASGGNEVHVIPIVGMGGIGKTTLAQFVYNDNRVDDYFHQKAWVCVSEEFDVLRITKTILESVTEEPCNFTDLNLLQVQLKKALSGKKFLIVLDDVWNQNYNHWVVLRNPFICGAQGSKIIVTTRSATISSIMSNVPAHHLGSLSNEDCYSLFVKHAFANKNSDTSSKLEVIGKKIADKCKGLPLAAKTMGGLLRSKEDEVEWDRILNSEIWELKEEEGNEILPALRLSYHHLPAHLKRCFAYCSLFPKDYEFDKEELVLLWMAEGFVPDGKNRMEDIGGAYFDDLLQRSFFQQSSSNENLFVMHNLVNDLARFISGEICFRLEGDDSYKISKKARHLSYHSDTYDLISKFEAFYKVVCLRTFLPLNLVNDDRYFPKQVPHDLFSRLRCLRVLCLRYYNITELPDSIGDLRHLRYLDLSFTNIKRLPESTCTIYNLQTLLLEHCRSLTDLPQNMGNLINLRHLVCGPYIRYHFSTPKMPLGIGRLTSLQELPHFFKYENSGSLIRELRDMSNLRGKLFISKLENIDKDEDAREANLRNKKHIGKLELEWSYDESRDEGIEHKVLDWLQPHRNLKELTISSYSGIRFPSWIGDPSFSNLVILRISGCRKCKSFPPLGQLPSLQDLTINGMDGVKSVGREFYGDGSVKQFGSLKKLKISFMREWEEWIGIEEEECVEFPCLLELSIKDCHKLKKVSLHFPVLVELDINSCEELTTFPRLPMVRQINIHRIPTLAFVTKGLSEEFGSLQILQISSCPRFQFVSMSGEEEGLPTSLEYLDISDCDKIEKLPETTLPAMLKCLEISDCVNLKFLTKEVMPNNTSLETLMIKRCHSLKSLPEGLRFFTSLQSLEISDCPRLVSFPEGGLPMTNLRVVSIEACKNLKSLPVIHRLTSIEKLEIRSCPNLVSFPEGGLPTNCKSLGILDCEKLEPLTNWGLQRLTSLRHITLASLHGGFQSMIKAHEELTVIDCPKLASLPEEGLPTTLTSLYIKGHLNLESLSGLHNLTSIQRLKVIECPKLVSLPEEGLPTTLTSLEIEGLLNLESLSGLHNLTSIQILKVVGCPKLVTLPEEGLPTTLTSLYMERLPNLESLSVGLHNLTSLQELTIFECPKLVSLFEEGLPTTLTSFRIKGFPNLESLSGLHNLTSIQRLTISECPNLNSFPEGGLPTTLRSLFIKGFPNLESLYDGLHYLTSIQRLTISKCPKLASLSDEGLPTTLLSICIWKCPLLAKRCQIEKGEDWPKIAHIPCIGVDVEEIYRRHNTKQNSF